jgi:uncharacterized membrane protein YdjX (TVP38/TMEM64 family)
MNKPAFWIWLLAAPVLIGIFITVLLNVESAQPALKAWILASCAVSMLITIPFALKVGKAME